MLPAEDIIDNGTAEKSFPLADIAYDILLLSEQMKVSRTSWNFYLSSGNKDYDRIKKSMSLNRKSIF